MCVNSTAVVFRDDNKIHVYRIVRTKDEKVKTTVVQYNNNKRDTSYTIVFVILYIILLYILR